MNTTYITLLNIIEIFAKEHLQIQKFASDFSGQLPNFATKDEAYPILFVTPNFTTFNTNTNTITIDVYCLDIIQKDRANINTILSDTLSILNDLNRWFKDGEIAGADLITSTNAIPLNNGTLDYTAGWKMSLTLELNTYGVCEIPFNQVPIITETFNEIFYSNYLTCETIVDCPAIVALQELVDNFAQGEFTCDDLPACDVIIDIESGLATLDADVIRIDADVIGLQEQITNLPTGIDCDDLDACANIIAIKSDILELSGTTATHTTQITTIQGNIIDINTDTFNLDTRVTTNETNIFNQDLAIGTIEGDITNLQGQINAIPTGIDCDELDTCPTIVSIKSDILTNQNDIIALETSSNDVIGDIVTLSGVTGTHTTQIGGLQTQIDDLPVGLDCETLKGCQEIIDINSDITALKLKDSDLQTQIDILADNELPPITGGVPVEDADNVYNLFYLNGNVIIGKSGVYTFYIIGAGGAGGNSTTTTAGGGGGAGQVIEYTGYFSVGSYPYVNGEGGLPNSGTGNGSSTTFNGITAIGGTVGLTNDTGVSGGSNDKSGGLGYVNETTPSSRQSLGGGGAGGLGAGGDAYLNNGGTGGAGLDIAFSEFAVGGGGGGIGSGLVVVHGNGSKNNGGNAFEYGSGGGGAGGAGGAGGQGQGGVVIGVYSKVPSIPLTCESLAICDTFTTLEGQVSGLQTVVNTNTSDITSVEGDVAIINGQISTIQGEITSIETDLTQSQIDILELSGTTGTHTSQIGAIETDILAIEGVDTAQDLLISGLQGQINALPAPFTCADVEVCPVITTIQGDITAIEGDILVIQGDITTIEAKDLVQDGLIGDNATAIGLIEAKDLVQDGLITGLQTQIDELPTGGGTFDCDELNACPTIITINEDITILQNNILGIDKSYIAINFEAIEVFEYLVPEPMQIDTIDNPTTVVLDIKVNGIAYVIGEAIGAYDILTIMPDKAGFIKVNCTKINPTADNYIGVDFDVVEEFSYIAPESFRIDSIINPDSMVLTIEDDGVVYVLGTTIDQYSKITITTDKVGFVKLKTTNI